MTVQEKLDILDKYFQFVTVTYSEQTWSAECSKGYSDYIGEDSDTVDGAIDNLFKEIKHLLPEDVK